ncbi:aminobenzoyl-glutamate transporter [Tersicoccus solisilvae]|uniref:Aminobenzoyl-glutamate transporter n=1 Tax=Tersicoccus solisilvae TaxID=1882339 RepID=A0ABQ1NVN6_9MICC|nr:AbgT family transporter [Tersicoccus solisilvae]GGC84046.1 aminobenzoyl-glutamate transporter [Tersicoccus solisilvae]
MTTSHGVSQEAPLNRFYRALSAIESAGNKLPHPFWLFVLLIVALGAVSAVLAVAGVTVTIPSSGKTVAVNNLFSVEGARFAIQSALTNYATFPPLAMVVVVLLGVSVAERSGLLTAILRITVGRLPVRLLTFAIAFSSMIAHIMSDSAYLVMIPLGALAFRAAGRSPVLGLMVAYASTAVGFNASPLVTPQDAIRSSLSTAAAQLVDPDYAITPVATYFFTAVSSVILAAAIAVFVDLVLARRPEFSASRLEADFKVSDRLFNTETATTVASVRSITLSRTESRALTLSALVFAVSVVVVVLMLLPGSPFLGENGGLLDSYVVKYIAIFIAVIFALLGITYGRITGTIPRLGDVPPAMAEGVRSLAPVLVLFFVVAQFLAYFTWTNIGSVVSVNGADLLRNLHAPHLIVLLVIVFAICILNMLITSGSAMWSILAPVIVPLVMYVGMRPEAAMVAFMIGDSVTNCITPLNGYFVLALGFVQQFRKGAGIGTQLSFTIPIAVVVLVVWVALFVLWYALGIPLGPGVPIR